MELPLKRLIDERFIRKKSGTCIVYIQYQYTSIKRTLLNTEIEIPPSYWDYDEGYILENLPTDYGKVEELNLELRRLYRVAEDIVLFISKNKLPNPGEFAKKTFSPKFDPVLFLYNLQCVVIYLGNSSPFFQLVCQSL